MPTGPGAAGRDRRTYVGGAGLARGYHERPALSAERFVPGSLRCRGRPPVPHRRPGAACATTGQVEYVGRIDHQVKIRGFRIELGEIEARLLEHPQVRERWSWRSTARAGKQLAGYVPPARWPRGRGRPGGLREALKTHLGEPAGRHGAGPAAAPASAAAPPTEGPRRYRRRTRTANGQSMWRRESWSASGRDLGEVLEAERVVSADSIKSGRRTRSFAPSGRPAARGNPL
ncbi:hypothetical protein ACPA9J_18985 [Pseudomonas aeruginosa]